MCKKILVMGLPGAGKTTIATQLSKRISGVLFNADEIRSNINKDLKFSIEDRIEQSRRMGWLCDQVIKSGTFAIADFICPTSKTRDAFGKEYFLVWVDRIKNSRYEDTDKIFEAPTTYDVRVDDSNSVEYWVELIASKVDKIFNQKSPTALFVGRFQPFHDGHISLIEEGIKRVGQACIAVRDTTNTDKNNPFSFHQIKNQIEHKLKKYLNKIQIIQIPNISAIYYGRDVGYKIEQINLDDSITAISATDIRKKLNGLF